MPVSRLIHKSVEHRLNCANDRENHRKICVRCMRPRVKEYCSNIFDCARFLLQCQRHLSWNYLVTMHLWKHPTADWENFCNFDHSGTVYRTPATVLLHPLWLLSYTGIHSQLNSLWHCSLQGRGRGCDWTGLKKKCSFALRKRSAKINIKIKKVNS